MAYDEKTGIATDTVEYISFRPFDLSPSGNDHDGEGEWIEGEWIEGEWILFGETRPGYVEQIEVKELVQHIPTSPVAGLACRKLTVTEMKELERLEAEEEAEEERILLLNS